MSVNTLRYKHKCKEDPPPPPKPPPRIPKAAPKTAPKAAPKAAPKEPRAPRQPRLPAQDATPPDSPTTRLRDLYTQVRLEQLEKKRNRFAGFFD